MPGREHQGFLQNFFARCEWVPQPSGMVTYTSGTGNCMMGEAGTCDLLLIIKPKMLIHPISRLYAETYKGRTYDGAALEPEEYRIEPSIREEISGSTTTGDHIG